MRFFDSLPKKSGEKNFISLVLFWIDYKNLHIISVHNVLLFTPCPVTRFAMHRNDAECIISRRMSRDFRVYNTKTPRGIVTCEQ